MLDLSGMQQNIIQTIETALKLEVKNKKKQKHYQFKDVSDLSWFH